MPLINVNPMIMQNGDVVTSYTNTVGTVQETFTFLKTQEKVRLKNNGNKNISYTIAGQSGTLGRSETVEITGTIDSLVLSAEQGTQQFAVWADEIGSVSVTPEAISSITTQLAQTSAYNDSIVVNALYPPNGLSAAKGDGVSDDFNAIQSLINFVSSKGGGTLYFPPTANGYMVSPNVIYKDNVKLVGTNTKVSFKSNSTTGNGFYNMVDNLNLVHIEGFNFVTSKDYSITDTYGTYQSSNLALVHIKNAKKIVLKDITSDNFHYTLKVDVDATIGELITENVVGTNGIMFFLLNNVGKWTGKNLTSSLTNTTQLCHHYYLQRGLKNVDLNQVTCNNGAGYFFHFNDAIADSDAVRIENFVVNHLTVTDCLYGMIISAPVNGLYIRDAVIKNQSNGPVLQIWWNCANIELDGFRLLNCRSIVNSNRAVGEVNNIRFKKGYIDQLKGATATGTIDTIVFDDIYFANANWLNSTGDMTFALSGTYTLCVMKNIILNFPTTITNNASIRVQGTGKFIFDRVIANGAAGTTTLGQLFYFPGTSIRTVTISNCESNMFSSFIYGTGNNTVDASVTLNKFNNLQKGVLVS